MPLSSHWFLVTGTGTFQLLMMMVVALFAVQSSMAHPSSTSAFRPSIHEYQEKQANRSALTLSGSLANSSQLKVAPLLKSAFSSGDDSIRGRYGSCEKCLESLPGSVCVDGQCYCPVGYKIFDGKCDDANCTEDNDCCKWVYTYCNEHSKCVCTDGYEPHPELERCVKVPPTPSTLSTPSTSSIPTTTSSTTSTSSSTTTSTELPSTSTTSTTSSWFSKNTILIVGILVFVLVMALTLLYIFGCHCCRQEAKIGDTSGANYRRQAYQPSPANSKVTSNVSSKASSKATSKAASNATSKATSKINSAKATSKH